MKKNMTKKSAVKKGVISCEGVDNGNGGATVSVADGLVAEFAAQIAKAETISEADAEELGRKAVAKLAAEAEDDGKVECIGIDCGRRGELSARTLVVRDSETIQPVCLRCEAAARRANLAIMPYGMWQERRDKFAAKVDELRELNIATMGGAKKFVHAVLLEMSEDVLEKAMVVSLKDVPIAEIRGVIMQDKLHLSAFLRTHDARDFFVDPAKDLLDRFEQEERAAKKQEDYFRRIAEAKQQRFAARGARRQQGDRARVSQFANMAAGGNGKPPAQEEIIPQGIELGAASLTHSPFVGLNLETQQ